MRSAAVTVALLVALVQARHRGMPRQVLQFECLDSADCGLGRCCIVRPDRYSYPSCHPHGQLDDMCRPSARPFNTSLVYPDGTVANITNAHYIMCACARDLACSRGKCVDPQSTQDPNSVEQD